MIEHPGFEFAGLYVYSDEKVGRDAGDLCGLEPTGITATREIDEIVALEPDCVLYMPRICDFDEVCRLLASGANIVTTRGEFHRAESMERNARALVEAGVPRRAERRSTAPVAARVSSPRPFRSSSRRSSGASSAS